MVVPSLIVIVLILFSPEFGVCEARTLSVDGRAASAMDLNPIAATVAAPPNKTSRRVSTASPTAPVPLSARIFGPQPFFEPEVVSSCLAIRGNKDCNCSSKDNRSSVGVWNSLTRWAEVRDVMRLQCDMRTVRWFRESNSAIRDCSNPVVEPRNIVVHEPSLYDLAGLVR